MDIDNNQRYATKEIDHCIRVLTHMVNNDEDFVALPREKQIELVKIAGQLSRPDCHQLKQRNKAVRKIKRETNGFCGTKGKGGNRDSNSQAGGCIFGAFTTLGSHRIEKREVGIAIAPKLLRL